MPEYTVTKRVVIEYTYNIEATTGAEARRVAEDIGEVNADEIANVRESWSVKSTEPKHQIAATRTAALTGDTHV